MPDAIAGKRDAERDPAAGVRHSRRRPARGTSRSCRRGRRSVARRRWCTSATTPFTSAAATSLANLANKQISVQVRGGGAHVAIDVVGYFKPAVNSATGAFEVALGGSLALQIKPDATSPILIAGSSVNTATAGASGASIGGGGAAGTLLGQPCGGSCANRVTDAFGTVGGGAGNQAGDAFRHRHRQGICDRRRRVGEHCERYRSRRRVGERRSERH